MLPPEVIERIRREREERQHPGLQIPLYPPEDVHRDRRRRIEDEETTQKSRVIVIEL